MIALGVCDRVEAYRRARWDFVVSVYDDAAQTAVFADFDALSDDALLDDGAGVDYAVARKDALTHIGSEDAARFGAEASVYRAGVVFIGIGESGGSE